MHVGGLQRIVWLASFPKSGNTWVRTFLASYFLGDIDINHLRRFTTGDGRLDFFHRAAGGNYDSSSDFMAYAKVRTKALELIAASRDGHHFVKTHTRIQNVSGIDLIPPRLTAAAIYIVRNPFDVAPSLARHNNVDIDQVIEMMTSRENIMSSDKGIWEFIGRWDEHVHCWTGAAGLPHVMVRYEDLHANPQKGFQPIFNFLQIEVDQKKLRQALKASSFNALRKQEGERGFIEKPPHMEKFFHSGKAGGWRETLNDAQVAKIHQAFEPALQQYYPEIVEETAAIAARL